jgi:hypothetical protein
MRGMERPLEKQAAQYIAGFVEAARFLGGQFFVPSQAKISRCRFAELVFTA